MRKIFTLVAAIATIASNGRGQTSTTSAQGSAASAGQPSNGPPQVCANDADRHRFDFWIGEWDVTMPDGHPAGSSVIQSVSGGCALLENWTRGSGGHGKRLKAHKPGLKPWQPVLIRQDRQVAQDRSRAVRGKSLA